MAAQPVEQTEAHVEINSQKSVEQKVKGDKSQPEITQVNKVEFSVLKVTEELEICSLDKSYREAGRRTDTDCLSRDG